MSYSFSDTNLHNAIYEKQERSLAFDRTDIGWKRKAYEKLAKLIAYEHTAYDNTVDVIYEDNTNEEYTEIKFVFHCEEKADVPCYLLLPKKVKPPFRVAICLQGHTKGMYVSMGRLMEGDMPDMGDRNFAVQAVKRGYAAIAMEQRGFGERSNARPKEKMSVWDGKNCLHISMTALMLGRTMVGERVKDVSRLIDVLPHFPQLDLENILCMGNSGGGTVTYYAACLDERIKIAMPSCSICTFRDSIFDLDHCMCNYVPQILQYFEMADLAGLIAPRKLIVVAGRDDKIFPIYGVKKCYETIQSIYSDLGVKENCRLIVGGAGHRFYADLGWSAAQE